MPTFNDSENRIQITKEGDYPFTVIEFDQALSKGSKTAGSTMYKPKLEIELPGGQRGPHVYESLIDHSSCAWKIDTFLKCCGVALAKGEAFEFDGEEARRLGVRHVNPYGLRGWAHFIIEVGTDKKERNKVSVFYTNKQKLPRDESVKPPQAAEPVAAGSGVQEEDVPF